jgi:hypothetical protein
MYGPVDDDDDGGSSLCAVDDDDDGGSSLCAVDDGDVIVDAVEDASGEITHDDGIDVALPLHPQSITF